MNWKRLAVLLALAGLGLSSGCATSPAQPVSTAPGQGTFLSRLCSRFRLRDRPTPIEAGMLPVADGPLLADHGGFPVLPPGAVPCPPVIQPGIVPVPAPGPVPGQIPMAPAPRLVPQPQATPMPFTP